MELLGVMVLRNLFQMLVDVELQEMLVEQQEMPVDCRRFWWRWSCRRCW